VALVFINCISHLEDGLWKITVKNNHAAIPEREFHFYKGIGIGGIDNL